MGAPFTLKLADFTDRDKVLQRTPNLIKKFLDKAGGVK